jgi:hypothetical protein
MRIAPYWLAVRSRAHGKVKRALLSAPLLRAWDERRYAEARTRHLETLKAQAERHVVLLEKLEREMIAIVDGSPFIPSSVLTYAREQCRELARDVSARSTVECAYAKVAPTVYAWGLAQENLDLAECYLGLPVRYLGVSIKREKADTRALDVRQWHIDVEDRRMLKMIVYLDEVGIDDGPFEYLDRSHTVTATKQLRYSSGFVSDTAFAHAVARTDWQVMLGPPLTVALVDTCRLFHRARPPKRRDRYSMSFSYCSERAHQVFPEFLPPKSFVHPLTQGLDARQRAAAACA